MTAENNRDARILIWDIETSPSLAHVWDLWNTNVNPAAIQIPGEVICFAAKWLDNKKTIFRSIHHDGHQAMLDEIWRLLNEADIVISYNGKRFDTPHINRAFLKAGMKPPSPYRHVDLDETTKRVFKFPSHSLTYVSGELGLGHKTKHEGYGLWKACVMDNDPAAWKRMRKYNIQDVALTEALYYKLLAWVRIHPNLSVMSGSGTKAMCPACGSDNLNREGFAYTQASKFQRYSCNNCGRWSRDTHRMNTGGSGITEVSA